MLWHNHKTAHKIFTYGIVLSLFTLPFGGQLSNIIFAITSIYWIWYSITHKALIFHTLTIVFLLKFISLCIGLLYSKNLSSGLFIIEKYILILIVPLAYSNINKLTTKNKQIALFSFCISCFLLTSFFIIRGLLFPNQYLFYHKLTIDIIHPVYLGIYIITSFYISITYINRSKLKHLKIFHILNIVIAPISLFVLQARTPLIILFITLPIFLALVNWRYIFLFILLSIGSIIIITNSSLLIKSKLRYTRFAKSAIEQRVGIWNSSLSVIKDNYFLGVGTGDFQDELNQAYISDGFKKLAERNLNPHNQYILDLLRNGILGFTSTLLILFVFFYFSFSLKDPLLFVFSISILIIFVTEAFLEAQRGILFLLSIGSLLINSNNKDS
ncbi:O-antigen ligase family protein [Limibacter armeniacum]|uniref:O-antigen ligase family protein n=1 Tax=Limibacter armeniacum TaxID=466084 RepID=UPI002FE5D8D2